jgi:hypothetical protein
MVYVSACLYLYLYMYILRSTESACVGSQREEGPCPYPQALNASVRALLHHCLCLHCLTLSNNFFPHVRKELYAVPAGAARARMWHRHGDRLVGHANPRAHLSFSLPLSLSATA